MERADFMVETAQHVLEAVINQFRRKPYWWLDERGVQAEIGSRLSQIFALVGWDTIEGELHWGRDDWPGPQSWNRVSYDPPVYLNASGTGDICKPDIVIWDDVRDGVAKPGGQYHPILWACELKYGSTDDGSADVKKLKQLLDQGGRIAWATAVNFHYQPRGKPQGIKTLADGHLKVYDVHPYPL